MHECAHVPDVTHMCDRQSEGLCYTAASMNFAFAPNYFYYGYYK